MRSYGDNVILKPQPITEKRASGIIEATHSLHSRLIRQVYPYIAQVVSIPSSIKSKVEFKVNDKVVYMRWGAMEISGNLLACDSKSIIARAT